MRVLTARCIPLIVLPGLAVGPARGAEPTDLVLTTVRPVGLVLVVGRGRQSGQERTRTIGARIVVNGREVSSDVPPKIVDATILVPLRFISEALGGVVSWDPARRAATIKGYGRTVTARIGDPIVRSDRQEHTAYTSPRIIGGRTMVPLRVVGYALGADVEWDARTQRVSIQTPRAPPAARPRPPTTERPPDGAGEAGLRVSLRADRVEYRQGEPIRLTLEAANPGAAPVTLPMSSGQRYDFEARRGDTVVWRWSDDRFFTQALTQVTIPPRDRLLFEETWNGRNRQGQTVEPGEYTIVGSLVVQNAARPQGRVTVRIRPAP